MMELKEVVENLLAWDEAVEYLDSVRLRYFVDNLGNIYVEKKSTGEVTIREPKLHNGSLTVTIAEKRRPVHNVVWEAFNGEIPKGKTIKHINCEPEDCSLDNLKLIDKFINISDKQNLPVWIINKRNGSTYWVENFSDAAKVTKMSLSEFTELYNDSISKKEDTFGYRSVFGWYQCMTIQNRIKDWGYAFEWEQRNYKFDKVQ